MSYCRWSSDDFRCDLYCYQSEDGYVTHVATCRYVGETPPLPPFPLGSERDKLSGQEWADAYKAQMDWLDNAEQEAIGGPFDGETFTDDLDGFRERLIELRAAGYRFPDYVLSEVDEEIAEATRPLPSHAMQERG